MAGVLCALGGNRPFTVLKLATRHCQQAEPEITFPSASSWVPLLL